MNPTPRGIRPGVALLGTDPLRGVAALATLPALVPALPHLPRGAGRPVLVLPGLGAADPSTLTLRGWLRTLGHAAYGWGLGTNVGLTAHVVDGLPARLEQLARTHDEPVGLVGWSLGGILARRLARARPDLVRGIVTLGSPIRLLRHEDSNARRLYAVTGRTRVEELSLPLERGLGPVPVPATSVFSRLDGIVAWQSCLDEPGEQHENVEVRSAHLGFGHHGGALYVVADRLGQPTGQWRPFRPPAWLRPLFPRSG